MSLYLSFDLCRTPSFLSNPENFPVLVPVDAAGTPGKLEFYIGKIRSPLPVPVTRPVPANADVAYLAGYGTIHGTMNLTIQLMRRPAA